MGKEKLGKLNPLGTYHKKQALKQRLKMKEKMGVRRQLQEQQKQQQQEKFKQLQSSGQHFENQFQLPLYRKDGNIAAIDPSAIDENPEILNEFLTQFHKNNKQNKRQKQEENLESYLEGVEFPEIEQHYEINIKQETNVVKQQKNSDEVKIKKQEKNIMIAKEQLPMKEKRLLYPQQQLPEQLQLQQQQKLPQLPQLPQFPQLPELPSFLEQEQINEQEKIEKKVRKEQQMQQQNTFDPCMMNTFNKKQEVQFLNKSQYEYYQTQYAQKQNTPIVQEELAKIDENDNYVIRQKQQNTDINPIIEKEADLKIKRIDVTKEKVQFVPRCLKVKTQNHPKEFYKVIKLYSFREQKILSAKEIKKAVYTPLPSFFLSNQEIDQTNKLSQFLNDINNLE